MWCRKTLWPTPPTSYLTSPPCNYASSEHAAAEHTGATSAPAAPVWRRHPQPSRYEQRPGKPLPKPSPCWTPSFPGSAVRKGDFPGTSLPANAVAFEKLRTVVVWLSSPAPLAFVADVGDFLARVHFLVVGAFGGATAGFCASRVPKALNGLPDPGPKRVRAF